MSSGRQIHVITPGDHYSPRTGSAVVQVVHGIAEHTFPRPAVLVACGTYPERYESAEVLEYPYRRKVPGRVGRVLDVARGRFGQPRNHARAEWRQVLGALPSAPSMVIAHNGPALVGMIPESHESVLYAHNSILHTYSRRETSTALGRVDHIVCVSNYIAEVTSERLPHGLRDRIAVIHNGVDIARFQALPRQDRQDKLRVLYVGRVVPWKGVHVLIKAIRALERDDLEVTILGSSGFDAAAPLTGYETRLRRVAENSKSKVQFMPFQPPAMVARIMREADVVVVPSVEPEPFGLTALEGLAAGATVVASDIGGLPEVVGKAGILIPPGDPAILAGVLERIVVDSSTDAVGIQAHVEAFSWENAAKSLAQALNTA
ncbi:glycosyltransferase family 4 protein [Ornithinimicrobium sp. F0845]|uniref:glycosyltransferase family 4 protein n=1 Tax=Ornithinimicrobium sp. F0845 TaxID=2926412 RepID=UPI001FF4F084|nr:glycosyltransferase family 4 protein [Ornithinimicrobium sp. F0845]